MTRKLSRGEQVKIAAADYNRWQEAGKADALMKLGMTPGLVLPDTAHEGIILVKNTLPRFLKRYSVLGLRGTIPDPLLSSQQSTDFQDRIALKGETPSSVTTGRFCVIQTDAEVGEVVPALVSGVTPCRLSVTSITDEFADIEPSVALDQTRWLKTGGSGAAQILYHPEYTGEQWGVVRLSNKRTNWSHVTFNFTGTGTLTPSSGAVTPMYVDSMSPANGNGVFELTTDAPAGQIRVLRDLNPCVIYGIFDAECYYSRNNWSQVTAQLQSEYNDSGVWNGIGTYGDYKTAWPDVATLSSAGGYYKVALPIHVAVQLVEGYDLRGAFTVQFSGSSPTCGCGAVIGIYYQ